MEKELRILKILSVGLQGRFNDRVYYIVDGKQRTRGYKIPADPKTAAQKLCRERMAALVKRWHALNGHQKNYWNAAAKLSRRKRTTGFNMFIRNGLMKAKSCAEALKKKIPGWRENRARRMVRRIRPAGKYWRMSAYFRSPCIPPA